MYDGHDRQSRHNGLGDTLAAVIKKTTGKSPCGKCDRRRQWLNWLCPFHPLREVVLRAVIVVLLIIAITT
jgi:hypothetical protein